MIRYKVYQSKNKVSSSYGLWYARAVYDETVGLEKLAEHATRILVENIVKPLKEELGETRRYLEASKREMARLRKAIDTANSCKHHDDCPVLVGLRDKPKSDRGHGGKRETSIRGQPAE